MKPVRCAIYTRKSSEEGLEQGFNSLDAQREACAAYILSQASQGWTQVHEQYDDGGISGGTLERPGLQKLLADIAADRIDIIVVYKVDRLTRSLLDFAKLVEAFDKTGVSFVSITQAFNTTTSMGRLTLNMLLSFAQFEREVTAERIRDKIAASKAKGMWMGGTPPVGYEPDGRTLKIVEDHAELIRTIFTRYLELGNVRLLEQALVRSSLLAPERVQARSGRVIGGRPLSRGQLYKILNNRMYLGEIVHGEKVYPGMHPPIIDRAIWDRVQALLADNLQSSRNRGRAIERSLLAGKIFDGDDQPLASTHACKGKVRYRYYVSPSLQNATGNIGLRIPAREIEKLVCERLAALFDDPVEFISIASLPVSADDYVRVVQRVSDLAARIRSRDHELIRALARSIRIEPDHLQIHCAVTAIAEQLNVACTEGASEDLVLTSHLRLTRSGRAVRLLDGRGVAVSADPNAALVRLVAQAHQLWGILRSEPIDITRLAGREGMKPSYLTRVLRLAFLSPALTSAILEGRHSPAISVRTLTLTDYIVGDWETQGRGIVTRSA